MLKSRDPLRRTALLVGASTFIIAGMAFTDVNAQMEEPNTSQSAAQGGERVNQGNTAQDKTGQDRVQIVPAGSWNYDRIYGSGWSYDRLIDEAEVIGPEGDDIGDVENLIIGRDGKVKAVIAEIGGFLDIGDTHVAVPWDRLYISPDLEEVEIPVTEDEIENYSVFKEEYLTRGMAEDVEVVSSELETGPNIVKASRLMNEDSYFSDGKGYGTITDLIFVGDQLHAVVVSGDAAYGGGYRALPYWQQAYVYEADSGSERQAGRPYYDVGYNEKEVQQVDEFDYDQMKDEVQVSDKSAAAGNAADRSDKRAEVDVSSSTGEQVTVVVKQSDRYGSYLADEQGRALYMFKADNQAQQSKQAKSACYNKCAEMWPPLTTAGEPKAGVKVRQNLLASIERKDGSSQVTYNGWPLYYYAKDSGGGEALGQDIKGFGAEWYLLTPSGKEVHAEAEAKDRRG